METPPAVLPTIEDTLPESDLEQAYILDDGAVRAVDRQLENGDNIDPTLLSAVASRLEQNAERDEEGNVIRYKGDNFFDEKRNMIRHRPVSQKTSRAVVAAYRAMAENPDTPDAWRKAAEHERILSASAKTSLTPSLSEAVKIARGETTLAAVVAERRTAHDIGLQELVHNQQAATTEVEEETRPTENTSDKETTNKIVEAVNNSNISVGKIMNALASNPEAIKSLTAEQRKKVTTQLVNLAEDELQGINPNNIAGTTARLDGFINANSTTNSQANDLLNNAFNRILVRLARRFGDDFVASYIETSTLERFNTHILHAKSVMGRAALRAERQSLTPRLQQHPTNAKALRLRQMA